MISQNTPLAVLKPKDFASDQDVRWCPGCGDYAILKQTQKVLANLGSRRENTVFVAGIGCSSRFPYYMGTYGFHTIHGRGAAVATGVKIANPELDVWLVTGDGDGLSIGGNHLMHALRRNVGLNIMLFNNRIYGLTKGQYSPTSEQGKKTPSTPMGSIDPPLSPLSIAVAAEASFVARSVDVDKSLTDVLETAAKHPGTSLVEIYQDCNVFNHEAFAYATGRRGFEKEDHVLRLEAGQPMIFGKDRDKGIRLTDLKPEVVQLGDGVSEADLLVHDPSDHCLAFLLSRLRHPEFPEPVGVIYAAEKPRYEELVAGQVAEARERRPDANLRDLLHAGETFTVEA
ncbi:2-oxoacid:ferredoxin oxidoreductase subunit beta [Mucisphaera calidilacus]|uniref:2-oxoglutarate oxidoreductase subunit KorB n=1 Tax=Mucisphaera calidilacus TaxID=2527982 RepID=A0A518BYP7_9BACT|nr:2-oxoacid:ferredoxin oxidoreductase subunit beta [Mucisphaera calidilacus]QDU72088.1 2-oxoglutarate oxidoreductase subunit KorB [Mucisphaera calidilacus]